MEKQTIKKTGVSKVGPWLLIDDGAQGSFRGCTPQVNKFLSEKVPCTVEIQETTGEGKEEKVSKVRVLSSDYKPTSFAKDNDNTKLASMCVSYAKDLAMEGKIQVKEIASKASGFMQLVKDLAEGKVVEETTTDEEPSSSSEIQTCINEEGELN